MSSSGGALSALAWNHEGRVWGSERLCAGEHHRKDLNGQQIVH